MEHCNSSIVSFHSKYILFEFDFDVNVISIPLAVVSLCVCVCIYSYSFSFLAAHLSFVQQIIREYMSSGFFSFKPRFRFFVGPSIFVSIEILELSLSLSHSQNGVLIERDEAAWTDWMEGK